MNQPSARNAAPNDLQLARFAEYLLTTWEAVMRRQDAGPALKLAYLWLWSQAGARPGEVTVTCLDLGAKLGKSHEAARHWVFGKRATKKTPAVPGLVALKWVEVIAHDKTGTLHLYLEDPAWLDAPRRFVGDRQQVLLPEETPADTPSPPPDTTPLQPFTPERLATGMGRGKGSGHVRIFL